MSSREQLKPGEDIPGTSYRVIRLLGQGGMGSVYEVEHQELGKRFVLKTLLSELSNRADLVQRLRTEWRALGKLEHPNIVRVSDAGVAQGKFPYFVMERLMGETLADRLARQPVLPIELAIKLAVGVLDALSVAHNIGIIHRDVKPPNIFVTEQDQPKLLDFGIAKLVDASSAAITARGVAVGTPRYMSPEQAAGDPVDARADLYAVGLVLYEMVSGKGPYRASDANELFLAHLTQPAPPLSTQARGVSLELDATVASMLAKSPAERPQSAKAAAQALRAALALYQKPGATPLVNSVAAVSAASASSGRGQTPGFAPYKAAVGVRSDTAPVDQTDLAATRLEGLQQANAAPTNRFDPQSVQSTHAGPNHQPTAAEPMPARRGSSPEISHAGSTVRIEGRSEDRRSDPPKPSSWAHETRTAAAPLASVEMAGTPPPVTRGASTEVYRRWLFPAVAVVLAVVAIVLARSNMTAQQSAASSASPVPPSPTRGIIENNQRVDDVARTAVTTPLPAAPVAVVSAAPAASAAPSASTAVALPVPRPAAPPRAPAMRAPAAQPATTTTAFAPAPSRPIESWANSAPLPAGGFEPEPTKMPGKSKPTAEPRKTLPPSGL